jgi:hypothetical protein
VEGIESMNQNGPVKLRMARLITAWQGPGGKKVAKEALARDAAAGVGGEGWESAACGRSHTTLVGKDGRVDGVGEHLWIGMYGWMRIASSITPSPWHNTLSAALVLCLSFFYRFAITILAPTLSSFLFLFF